MITVGALAKRSGVSRTTLLYYEGVGLLAPSARSAAGYRQYAEDAIERVMRIRDYRATGMALGAIKTLLDEGDSTSIIEQRLQEISREMAQLREQQAVLLRLLGQGKVHTLGKDGWTALLRAAGLDDAAMQRWHALFEQQSPDAHQHFLISLGVSDAEVLRIRSWARDFSV
ncbi:MAG: MerR family transcriptional regulator [Pseudomonadota bacterium]